MSSVSVAEFQPAPNRHVSYVPLRPDWTIEQLKIKLYLNFHLRPKLNAKIVAHKEFYRSLEKLQESALYIRRTIIIKARRGDVPVNLLAHIDARLQENATWQARERKVINSLVWLAEHMEEDDRVMQKWVRDAEMGRG